MSEFKNQEPEQEAVKCRKVRTLSMRPGMNEVTLYCEKGVPGFADPGCEFYVCDTHPDAEIERLRAELELSHESHKQTLQKMAEAQALLARVINSGTAQPAEVKS